jgi:hypothetical protein
VNDLVPMNDVGEIFSLKYQTDASAGVVESKPRAGDLVQQNECSWSK